MKRTRLFLTAGLVIGTLATGFGQDLKTKDVPTPVKEAFRKGYPKARDIEWEKSGDDYRVSFEIVHVDHEAVYQASGKTVSTQKEISPTLLPKSIAANIRSQYPQAYIDDVEQINVAGKISYKIGIDGNPDATLYYNADGKFLNAVAD